MSVWLLAAGAYSVWLGAAMAPPPGVPIHMKRARELVYRMSSKLGRSRDSQNSPQQRSLYLMAKADRRLNRPTPAETAYASSRHPYASLSAKSILFFKPGTPPK